MCLELDFVIALSVSIAEGGTRYIPFVALLTLALLLCLAISGTDNPDMRHNRLLATLSGIIISLVTITALKYPPRRSLNRNPD